MGMLGINQNVTDHAELSFDIKIGDHIYHDIGEHHSKFEYKAMLNHGEVSYVVLDDIEHSQFNAILSDNADSYFGDSKSKTVDTMFQLTWNRNTDDKTKRRSHKIIKMIAYEDNHIPQRVGFISIDIPSYYLNAGDAAGCCYKGNIKSVIEQVVHKYGVDVDIEFIGDTSDSKENRWWQYRQDPKTFIISLLNWSSSLSDKQTKWLIYPDNNKLIIREQASLKFKHKATYVWTDNRGSSGYYNNILKWEMLNNNYTQLAGYNIVTSGISAITGKYYSSASVGDQETSKKYKAKVNRTNAYTKPSQNMKIGGVVGQTSVIAIPEFSGGDTGIDYSKYIDGTARNNYLNIINTSMRIKLRVMGHHIWSESSGLGIDTINIVSNNGIARSHFIAGNWIVYGFHHIIKDSLWTTDLYCVRLDRDADAVDAGKGLEQSIRNKPGSPFGKSQDAFRW